MRNADISIVDCLKCSRCARKSGEQLDAGDGLLHGGELRICELVLQLWRLAGVDLFLITDKIHEPIPPASSGKERFCIEFPPVNSKLI